MYYPEGFLSQWFLEGGEDITVWMMARTGVRPLVMNYKHLVKKLNIDAILLVDGGVDSIMRGDEEGPGTLVEDSISLAAVDEVDVPVKLLACIGFGTEVEEAVCHHHALDNIAALTKTGGFLGTCSLLPQMPVYQKFEEACRYVWEQPTHKKSHITTRVIPAAQGEFGDYHMYDNDKNIPLFISPLMSLYWFFDADKVIERSLIVPLVGETYTTQDAFVRFMQYYQGEIKYKRRRKTIPY